MTHFLITLLVSVGLLAAIGWATHWLHQNHGPAGEQVFRSLLALMVAGLVLVLTFGTNYVLASTGLKRLTGSEQIVRHDPIARLLFGGSQMRLNHLFALAIVVASFVSCAYFLRAVGQLFEHLKSGAWRRDRAETARLLLGTVFLTAVAGYSLWLDDALLLARTSLMMYTDAYAGAGAALPAPAIIMREHGAELGGYLLGILAAWYPLYILMAEKHFASSRAHYSDACRALAASHAAASAALAGAVPPPAVPNAGGGAASPPVVPPVMVVPPVVPITPLAGQDGPVPGGAASLIRPVPFNPGPGARNGHH